jgi:hypothetical protein
VDLISKTEAALAEYLKKSVILFALAQIRLKPKEIL